MKALCWHGTGDVRVDTVADPTIQDPRDDGALQGSIAIYDDPKQLLDRLGQSPFYTETS